MDNEKKSGKSQARFAVDTDGDGPPVSMEAVVASIDRMSSRIGNIDDLRADLAAMRADAAEARLSAGVAKSNVEDVKKELADSKAKVEGLEKELSETKAQTQGVLDELKEVIGKTSRDMGYTEDADRLQKDNVPKGAWEKTKSVSRRKVSYGGLGTIAAVGGVTYVTYKFAKKRFFGGSVEVAVVPPVKK